nr:heparinase II/III-family protein [PVC group bacterium]
YDYIFWVATPDLGAPMFGDGARPLVESEDRATWPLYPVLAEATELLGDPKYRARAELDRDRLPEEKSHAFEEAGMYVLRSDWGPDQIHLGLHCSPLGISGHDQADNGTFELHAYGRWLMPDTGFYTYGHDQDARLWHRRTRVHQTLTLDDRDSGIDGRHLLWHADGDLTALVVENTSYEHLVHRRTVWSVDRRFFILFDEAIGDAAGRLDLHFQFAPGEAAFDADKLRAHTLFGDANVLVAAEDGAGWKLEEEGGWFAWAYGHRTRRKAFRFEHNGTAPTSFLTVVAPYRGTTPPNVHIAMAEGAVGDARVEATAQAFGTTWCVGRDLDTGTAYLS